MKIVFILFLVLCHSAWLFKGRHIIGRLEWRHVILNLAGNSFHCRSRPASDMTYKRDTTFVDESKDFYVKISGQSSCRRAERSWLVGVRRRERLRLDEKCLLRSSLHQYISNQQPIVPTTTVSSGDIHAHRRAVIPSFGSKLILSCKDSLFFELGRIYFGLGLMIFHKMSPYSNL